MILLPAEEEEATLGARPDKVRLVPWVRALLELRALGSLPTLASLTPEAASGARRDRTDPIL